MTLLTRSSPFPPMNEGTPWIMDVRNGQPDAILFSSFSMGKSFATHWLFRFSSFFFSFFFLRIRRSCPGNIQRIMFGRRKKGTQYPRENSLAGRNGRERVGRGRQIPFFFLSFLIFFLLLRHPEMVKHFDIGNQNRDGPIFGPGVPWKKWTHI